MPHFCFGRTLAANLLSHYAHASQLLTDAERTRLNNFPVVVEENDLSAFFTLTDADLNQVRDQRGDSNRLGFALQLGALRYLGFCPDDLKAAPDVVVHYLARQLNVAAATLEFLNKCVFPLEK